MALGLLGSALIFAWLRSPQLGGAITAYARRCRSPYNLRLKRMVILDVGAIATDENLAGKIQKLTNSANTVLIVVNRDYLFPKGLIVKEMSDLYNLDSEVSFAYFKIYRFPKKRT